MYYEWLNNILLLELFSNDFRFKNRNFSEIIVFLHIKALKVLFVLNKQQVI